MTDRMRWSSWEGCPVEFPRQRTRSEGLTTGGAPGCKAPPKSVVISEIGPSKGRRGRSKLDEANPRVDPEGPEEVY